MSRKDQFIFSLQIKTVRLCAAAIVGATANTWRAAYLGADEGVSVNCARCSCRQSHVKWETSGQKMIRLPAFSPQLKPSPSSCPTINWHNLLLSTVPGASTLLYHTITPWIKSILSHLSYLHTITPWVKSILSHLSYLHTITPWVKSIPSHLSYLHTSSPDYLAKTAYKLPHSTPTKLQNPSWPAAGLLQPPLH